jgi:hypothetical protein
MCYVIYGALILLFLLYSDALLEPLSLASASADGAWMTVALGWEIVAQLWPLLVLAGIVSSFLTYLIAGRLGGKRAGGDRGGS